MLSKLNDSREVPPSEGRLQPLDSNESSVGRPSLGITSAKSPTDQALEYLAEVLVEAYLNDIKHEKGNA
jgi:hypothetical protein